MAVLEYTYSTRRDITVKRREELEERIAGLSKGEKALAEEIQNVAWKHRSEEMSIINQIQKSYRQDTAAKPRDWFAQKGGSRILDVFVPRQMQPGYLYIIDRLNQYPYTSGWNRRSVRTAGYSLQIERVFELLEGYELLFYCGVRLEDIIMGRLEPEIQDYLNSNEVSGMHYFSYLYAAEIDLGNKKVIGALEEVICSESNTSYLTREMILGILRSKHHGLHKLVCGLLLAAKLQEGLRQVICEAMDEGTPEAFMMLLEVIEKNNLIRFASVKRAISTWIGICDEANVDRINGKMLALMGRCLRDGAVCREQLETNDSIGISVALWAMGFLEAMDAIKAMKALMEGGTKNQKLTAVFYLNHIQNNQYKSRFAKRILLQGQEDMEVIASIMPAFTCTLGQAYNLFLNKDRGNSDFGYYAYNIGEPITPVLTDFFESREETESLYGICMEIYGRLPKKGVRYAPSVFPWHSVELTPSTMLQELALLAYLLQEEEKITRIAGLLGEISSGTYYNTRSDLVNLLLYEPKSPAQRELLIGYVGNAEEATSSKALLLVQRLTLEDGEYELLEGMLKYKRSTLRTNLIALLMNQKDDRLEACLSRLIGDKKEEKRTACLDMIIQLGKEASRKPLYDRVKALAGTIEKPTDRERILIEEVLGEQGKAEDLTAISGYGIYNPQVEVELPESVPDRELLQNCIPFTQDAVFQILKKLDALLEEHREYEYMTEFGSMDLLGNSYDKIKGAGDIKNSELEKYPLADILKEFYEKEIGSYKGVWMLRDALYLNQGLYRAGEKLYLGVFGRMPLRAEKFESQYSHQMWDILSNFLVDFSDKFSLFEESLHVLSALMLVLEHKIFIYDSRSYDGTNCRMAASVKELPIFSQYFSAISDFRTEDEFKRAFYTALRFELKYPHETANFWHSVPVGEEKNLKLSYEPVSEEGWFLMEDRESVTEIKPFWFLKAYVSGLIPLDMVYQYMLKYNRGTKILPPLTRFMWGEVSSDRNYWVDINFFGKAFYEEVKAKGCEYMMNHTGEGKLCRELYEGMVPKMVDVELRRGDSETAFSKYMRGIEYICGVSYLVRILRALGKDTLDRDSYYGLKVQTKRSVLSGLLQACYPAPGESAEDLRRELQQTGIQNSRLIETAMFAPQWIDIIEEYLSWEGLKSGCYYFCAHMDESLGDKKEAIIAKYTPLSPEELCQGAFDADWFRDAYGQLGEERFGELYRAAKYISDGTKHSRARKYADAATGKVTLAALKKEISAKRNKDLLMSYGLVPFGKEDETDMVERYRFLQQFLKESRQFGSARRASEGKAVEIALLNMSVNAGYSDTTRLTLNMESRLAEQYLEYMDWKPAEDVELKLEVEEDGKCGILCRKEGKALKSIPSRLGKHAYVLEIKEVNKRIKEQYSRTKKMLEEAMEQRTLFTAGEIALLFGNPAVKSIVESVVYVSGEKTGFLSPSKTLSLVDCGGCGTAIKKDASLRIAHPMDFYREGTWHTYQKLLFDRKLKQPFKQIYRELYVKLPEELSQKHSLMFAGHQIQPGKTVGCLKGRNWVADYEEGLQKIYYKDNIIAKIYAIADWFSPSEIEAPTLEWVEFSHRKTFQALTMEQVPDVIYSEVMRDVDLAVSVAHAGGVDPETSHSTIEMRRAIIEFNLPLFGLTNVILKENHAIIEGSRGKYNLHLGSGIIHQEGGAMLNILPVHSQSRGKLFLPFVDEDPKTAEIMSKIVLLAEDAAIKDPLILRQIARV